MTRIFALLLLALTLAPVQTFAAEPPKEPILRIEAGTHLAKINRLAADASGRWLVTSSVDKSLRVWDLQSGNLVRTIRHPIGTGNEGKLYGAAISPDGNIIAAGGWTGWEWDRAGCIYLFSRSTGNLIRRLEGLRHVASELAFSLDGRFLAVVTADNSVRLYRTSDWILVGEDKDYAGEIWSIDFSRNGNMVTASRDGFLRLYDTAGGSLSKISQVKRGQGRGDDPYWVRFSPDGTKILVGHGSGYLAIVSGRDLIEIPKYKKRFLAGSGEWSSSGKCIFFEKVHQINGREFVYYFYRVNLEKGTTKKILVPGSGPSLSLPGDKLVFSTGGIGLISDDGKLSYYIDPKNVGFCNTGYLVNEEKFQISEDGTAVRFEDDSGKISASFNIKKREIAKNAAGYTLQPPLRNHKGLRIEDFPGSIAPDGQSYVKAWDSSLGCYDRQKATLWSVNMPDQVLAVNISGNGKLVVCGLADGTIRWLRMTDGKELLALFPHADRKRWVLWTPSGYYDASTGGEELIGWHVNNGKDREADFFPASKFRATYYRPDIIGRILIAMDEAIAVAQANAETGRKQTVLTYSQPEMSDRSLSSSNAAVVTQPHAEATIKTVELTRILPPVVNVLSPLHGGTFSAADVPVRFVLRSPEGSPVTGIRVLVDGRPVSQTRGIDLKAKGKEGEQEVVATLPPRDCEVTIIAENANAASVPATIRLKWAGQAPKPEEFAIQPKLYVLAVGVSEYADPSLKLGLAAKDARDFAAALATQKGLLYRDVVTKVLADAAATKDDVLDALDWLQKETTSKDVAMLFLAGHGVNDPSGIYYYLPHNADTERLKRTGVPFSDIKNTLASIAGKTLFFVDTCHSGNVMGARRAVADINAVVNELSSAENGAVVFASSTGRQYSLEDPKWGNGAFTKALVEGIGGKADYGGKGKITVNMLDLYLSERVKELTGGKQTPTTTKPQTIQDFPIAVRR